MRMQGSVQIPQRRKLLSWSRKLALEDRPQHRVWLSPQQGAPRLNPDATLSSLHPSLDSLSMRIPLHVTRLSLPFLGHPRARCMSAMMAGEHFLKDFVNYEAKGVPDGAGTDTKDGFDLGRMRGLLSAMGDPQESWPAVHVAGTKGKGSTTAFLACILKSAGYKVGTYTSPHVVTLQERISVGTEPISIEDFDNLVGQQEQTLLQRRGQEASALSHFEVMTALAYKHFQQQEVDIAIVEAGLGGARDATNMFSSENLKLAIITAIGLEHQRALGNTLQEIAAAKAGIFKEGRPAVIAQQPEPEALAKLKECAATLECTVVEPQQILQYKGMVTHKGHKKQKAHLSLEGSSSVREVNMQLLGAVQLDNAATAVAAALQLRKDGFPKVTDEAIAEGLATATLPGRFQILSLGTSSAQEEDAPWVVLDGAHTPASAQALVSTMAEAFPEEPVALVVSMADDKDHKGILAALREAAPKAVIFTSVAIAGAQTRAAAPGKLAAQWQLTGMGMRRPHRCRELIQASMPSAIEAARRELQALEGSGVICVTGSLHAVAEALSSVDLRLQS